MNKLMRGALAAAGFVLAAPAMAQSNVTMYGILDAAVDYNTNADSAGNSRVWMPSLGGGMFPSRLGFRGAEDLGGGLKAIFTLENGFYVDSGAQGQNRLFGRQAWVGLSGSWGQLTFGRNYNMLYNSMLEVDIIGPSQYGLGAIDPAIPNGRSDNSVAYRGSFANLTVGATYSLGRDTSSAGGASGTNCGGESATDAQACREWSAMLKYDTSNWGAALAYDRINGGTGAAAGLVRSDMNDSRLSLGAYVKSGDWKLAAGVLRRDNDGSASTPRSNLLYLGASYRVTPFFVLDGELARLDYRDSANDTNQMLIRATYNWSIRTATYVAAGHVQNRGTAAIALSAGGSVGAGMSQNGIITGIKHSF